MKIARSASRRHLHFAVVGVHDEGAMAVSR